jgi:predicted MFS family arabinose efflux permease
MSSTNWAEADIKLILLVAGIILMLGAIAFGVGYAILRAAKYPQPTLLVMSLSMLTLLSVAAFVATDEVDLLTLTGVGFGALAGAVNAVFANRNPNAPEPSPPPELEEKDEGA